MRSLAGHLARSRQVHGDKFDPSDLFAAPFGRYWETGERIRVEGPAGIRTGTVGMTTGWRPAFLLMHRSSDLGSWDVLGPNDRVIAVRHNGRYVNVSP